jgi:hypothetical protein
MSLADNIQYTRTVEEYKKTGLPLRLDPQIAQKQRFYNKTKQSNVNIIEIRNVQRILAADGKEYLNWEQTVRRADGWENLKHETTSDMGISKKGIPTRGGGYDEDGNLVKKITGVDHIEDIFNTEATHENIEKLRPFMVLQGQKRPTQFSVKKEYGGYNITVDTYEDFLNGDFETLFKSGKAKKAEDGSSKGTIKQVIKST